MISHPKPEHEDRAARKKRFMALLMPVLKRLEDFAVAMTRNPDDACDLVSETVLLAYENFDRLRDEQAFLGYLFSIASREYRHGCRRAGRFSAIDPEMAEGLRATGSAPDAGADIDLLYRALAQLPERQREAIVLFELSGFSMKEIQEVQGGTITAIKVRLFRARKKLATLLGVDEPWQSVQPDAGRTEERSSHSEDDFDIRLRTAISE